MQGQGKGELTAVRFGLYLFFEARYHRVSKETLQAQPRTIPSHERAVPRSRVFTEDWIRASGPALRLRGGHPVLGMASRAARRHPNPRSRSRPSEIP